jgi:hypothetical protein
VKTKFYRRLPASPGASIKVEKHRGTGYANGREKYHPPNMKNTSQKPWWLWGMKSHVFWAHTLLVFNIF